MFNMRVGHQQCHEWWKIQFARWRELLLRSDWGRGGWPVLKCAATEWGSDCSECPQFNPISAPTTVHHPPKYPFNAPSPRQMYPGISRSRRKSCSFMFLAGNHNRCLGRLLSSGNGRSWSGRLPKWALIDFNFVVTMPARQGATKKLSCQRIQKV